MGPQYMSLTVEFFIIGISKLEEFQLLLLGLTVMPLRHDLQRRFLAQHSVATLSQNCRHKNRRCKSPPITSDLYCLLDPVRV